jgi:DNA-binding LacI/PurR family transcriptional regulator
MRSTIKDVANRANVSIATVSRYLNHSGYVNFDTAKRIKDAIKQLDYRPPKHAFKKEINTTIKVILPSITNPLYAEFYEEILAKLDKTPYLAVLEINNLEHPSIDPYLKQIKENKIAGIITSSPLEN